MVQIAATVIGAGVVIYGLVSYFLTRTIRPADKVNWNPGQAIAVAAAVFLVAQIVVAIIVSSIGIILTGSPSTEWLKGGAVDQFIFILLIEAATIAGLINFMRRRGTALKAIGVVRPAWSDAGLALVGALIYFLAYIAFVSIVSAVIPGLNLEQEQDIGFDKNTAGLSLIPIFISLVVLPPLVEEFIFRGFIYTGLRNRFKLLTAGLITSLIFAVAHLQFGSGNALLYVAAIDTFVLSMVMINLRERSGSLWPSIGLHAIKNGIAFTVLFIVK